MKKLVLALVAALILAPTALSVLVATFLAPMAFGLRGTRFLFDPVVFVALTLGAGWFGLATLVSLCSHFYKHADPPPTPRRAAFGLFCGTASALSLMAASDHPFRTPGVLLFGPLLAAAILGFLLWRSRGAV